MVTHSVQELTPARLPSGIPLRLTCHRYRGQGDGPTVYLQAAQHGREVNGTEVLRRVHEQLLDAERPLAGEVITVPVADPLTFDHQSYTAPEELDSVEPNMNRVWPGDSRGTLHERIAARLWELASDAAYLVDLHTASADTLPHVMYTAGDDAARRLANAFGTDLHLVESADEDAGQEWRERSFDGKFRVAAHRAGIPCITPELGDSQRLQEESVELGVAGVLDVLRAAGVLDGEPPARDVARFQNHLARVRAVESGLFRPAADLAPGASVDAGARLGTLSDPATFEPLQAVTAEYDGVLYALTRRGTVTAGDRLASVALPLDE